MPNQDGTGPTGKGSGTGRKRGTCGTRKSNSVGIKADITGSEEKNVRQNGRGRNSGLGKSRGKNKGLQGKIVKTSEFSNPEWWE